MFTFFDLGGNMVSALSAAAEGFHQYLLSQSPYAVAAGGAAAYAAIQKIGALFDAANREWLWDRLTYRLLQISVVDALFREKIDEQFTESAASAKRKWAPFGEPVRAIPEDGVSYSELAALVQQYCDLTIQGLKERQFSGTIYSKSLLEEKKLSFPEEPSDLPAKLEALFTGAFQGSYLWNSLHSGEFPIGSFLEYQAVQMAAELFGGENATGIVTSGGTESLMTAAKAYRNWGLERGIAEPVIVAPDSIHASVMKAAEDYRLRLVLVPTDEEGRVDMDAFRRAVETHGSNVVALFGSAPSYPKGKIDPIADLGLLAKEKGVGCHVDCCLGGFLVNFSGHPSDFLRWPGVTSFSLDTHKNGWAPKGSSVLIAQEMPGGKSLAPYFIYAIPDWTGGIYGTPRTSGSQSCLPALHAFLAMMAIGKSGYRQIADAILSSAREMASRLQSIPGIKLLGEPDLNVVSFRVDPSLGLMEGASYVLAKEMADRGFVLNTLRGDAVHFCLTGRFAHDADALAKFEKAACESLEAVQKLNAELIAKGEKFSGDAGLYCTVEAAIHPKRDELGWAKYFENKLFGEAGVRAAVKTYFLALMNPWAVTHKKHEESVSDRVVSHGI
jgi:glutamate/tyrosine decarboxylase-like PLP-dependent enzyme